MSKTPQFDKAINEFLAKLKPRERTCQQCRAVFDILERDIDFYRKFKVPPPSQCPHCRLRRRLGHRINLLPVFYKKSCSAPGHTEKIISFYSEENPVKVYDDQYYFSDQWDGLQFGQDYDFQKPFFEQFQQLALTVPHKSLFHDPSSVNCDYVVGGVASKNCYYVGVPYYSENVYYGSVSAYCKDCLDVMDSDECELCYSIVYCERCYNCNFCLESRDCLDSWFLYDCRGLSHCFGCTNLRNKQYYFFNQPLSKEEYEQKINPVRSFASNGVKAINTGSRKVLSQYKAEFAKMLESAVRRGVNNVRTENCLGDLLRNCRNCFYCFRVLKGGLEDSRYVSDVERGSDLMDVFGGNNFSLCYESTGIANSSHIKFSLHVRAGCQDLEYCQECTNCQDCFGCVGLKNKKYCIFNKQYSEIEYWQLVDKIKTEMLERGEYGQFFPLSISIMPYQDSTAQIEFPLSKEEILKNGWHWQEEVKSELDLTKFQILKSEQVQDDIADVSRDILGKVIICQETGKPFQIMPFELAFHRQKRLPLPVVHPLQRLKNHLTFRRHFRLWQVLCAKCGKTTPTSFDSKGQFKIYCEQCYLKEVV